MSGQRPPSEIIRTQGKKERGEKQRKVESDILDSHEGGTLGSDHQDNTNALQCDEKSKEVSLGEFVPQVTENKNDSDED